MTREEQIYDMTFEEAQDYTSKRGLDIPWNDDDVVIDGRNITQTVANVLAWADSHPHWIPVEEELPKEKQKVLAYFSPNEKCDHEYACEALYNYGFHHWEDAEDPGVILEGVTHWMPKPQPPRKEDK